MCNLTRRQLFLGGSGLILFGCGDSTTVEQAKDYYPVSQRVGGIDYIFHWGRNNTIVINENASDSTYSANSSSTEVGWFRDGVTEWASALAEVGVSTVYGSSSPDVEVYWLTSDQMAAFAGDPDVLGLASMSKKIYMLKGATQVLSKAIAIHEFGHMLGLWSHSFDSGDIMYPYAISSSLSNRDKRTMVDFLYQLTPDVDMHDLPGPMTLPSTGQTIPHIVSYFTEDGCKLQSHS